MSAPAPKAGPSGSGPVQAASQSDDVVVLSDVNMSSPPPAKPTQVTPKGKMKQSRLPFAPIQKESAINIQRQKQLKEQELLKAKQEEEQQLAEAKKAKEKEEAASKIEASVSEPNSKPSKEPFCKYQLGDLVWAKMKSFPAWPGKIVMGPDHIKLPTVTKHTDETMQCVRFFGTHDHAFIAEADIKPYLEAKEALGSTKGKPASFAKAVQEIEALVAGKPVTCNGDTPKQEPVRIQNPTVVVEKLPNSVVNGKKRKLSGSSDGSSTAGGGNRRKSARGSGQDKASDSGGDGRLVVKEANIPEVEII